MALTATSRNVFVSRVSHPAFARTDHRPWPHPKAPWVMRQTWRDLLFAHWPLPKDELRRFVPDGLSIQEWQGTSWVGVVPFRMTGVMARGLPSLPWISAFPELNVRLYVERDGKPGVWFLSLDAHNALAVWAARRFFHLPYVWADMSLRESAHGVEFDSRRRQGAAAHFRARYRPVTDIFESRSGTLPHFLTERYCLYAASPRGHLYRAEVHHLPWPLQEAEADLDATDLLSVHGLSVGEGPALLHFARALHVAVWPLERIR